MKKCNEPFHSCGWIEKEKSCVFIDCNDTKPETRGKVRKEIDALTKAAKQETANRITANILRIVNSSPGCVAYRINNVGVWDAAKKIHRAGNTQKGLPDVWGCANGRFFTVEVKAGKDRLSVHQQIVIQEITQAGGYAMVVRSTDDFISAWRDWNSGK